MPEYLNIKELSETIGISVATIYKAIAARQIPYVRIGRRVIFDMGSIRAWIDLHSVEVNGPGSRDQKAGRPTTAKTPKASAEQGSRA